VCTQAEAPRRSGAAVRSARGASPSPRRDEVARISSSVASALGGMPTDLSDPALVPDRLPENTGPARYRGPQLSCKTGCHDDGARECSDGTSSPLKHV
jgi:hypothetical protein